MSEQQNKQESAQLDEVSEDLTRGLQACHSLVDDYRLKLAANSNEFEAGGDEDQSRLG